MKKDLKYYMDLPYVIELVKIPESEGGGFSASLPEVGKFAIVGDGDTPEEAIENLNAIKEEYFSEYLSEGIQIPEPKREDDFSGKFVLRIPAILHMQLIDKAKKKNLSLNNYIKTTLEEHIGATELLKEIKSLKEIITNQNQYVKNELVDLQFQVQTLNESISSGEPFPVVKRWYAVSAKSKTSTSIGQYCGLVSEGNVSVGAWSAISIIPDEENSWNINCVIPYQEEKSNG